MFPDVDDTRKRRQARLVVDRYEVRSILLELQDLRARQGCDWRWMDGLSPVLRAELEAAIADECGEVAA